MIQFQTIRSVFEKVEIEYPGIKGFEKFTFAQEVFDMFKWLQREPREHFIVLHLNGSHSLICVHIASIGIANRSLVHPREIYSVALLSNACAIIAIHNHPSGGVTPSQDDIVVTKQLREAGELIGIRLLDHVIIGEGFYSFCDHGQI